MTPALRAARAPGSTTCAAACILLALAVHAQARVEPVQPAPMEPSMPAASPLPQPAVQPQAPAIQPSGSTASPHIPPSGSPQTSPLRLPETEDAAAQVRVNKLRASALANARRGSKAEKTAATSAWLLGLLYLHGEHVPVDRLQALRWFERARALGEQRASAGLAWCQIDGCQGPPSPTAARPWIDQLRTVDAGLALLLEWWVEERLAPMSAPRPHDKPPSGQDTRTQLLQRAAQAGNADALNELGLLHLSAARLPEAMAQFRAAADRSPAAASNARLLTSRMEQQHISAHSPIAADEWLAQARRYHRGDGVPSNYTEAIRLYQVAAASGSRAAKRMLELIYSRPAPDGTINVAWMRQLALMEVSPEGSILTMQAPPTPQLFVRDPTPLFILIPKEWRTDRAIGPR